MNSFVEMIKLLCYYYVSKFMLCSENFYNFTCNTVVGNFKTEKCPSMKETITFDQVLIVFMISEQS